MAHVRYSPRCEETSTRPGSQYSASCGSRSRTACLGWAVWLGRKSKGMAWDFQWISNNGTRTSWKEQQAISRETTLTGWVVHHTFTDPPLWRADLKVRQPSHVGVNLLEELPPKRTKRPRLVPNKMQSSPSVHSTCMVATQTHCSLALPSLPMQLCKMCIIILVALVFERLWLWMTMKLTNIFGSKCPCKQSYFLSCQNRW